MKNINPPRCFRSDVLLFISFFDIFVIQITLRVFLVLLYSTQLARGNTQDYSHEEVYEKSYQAGV
jgi:hypothetical protein